MIESTEFSKTALSNIADFQYYSEEGDKLVTNRIFDIASDLYVENEGYGAKTNHLVSEFLSLIDPHFSFSFYASWSAFALSLCSCWILMSKLIVVYRSGAEFVWSFIIHFRQHNNMSVENVNFTKEYFEVRLWFYEAHFGTSLYCTVYHWIHLANYAKTPRNAVVSMGVGRRGQEGHAPWIFIHCTFNVFLK